MAATFSGTLTVNGNTVDYTIMLPRGCSDAANGAVGRRAIIAQHGYAGKSTQMNQGGSFADHARYWCDRGYVVAAIDNGVQFYNVDAMDRLLALHDRLVTVLGCLPAVGLAGWSMGGGTVVCFAMLYPLLAACLYGFAPATDLRWVGAKAGYVPPYSTDGDTPNAQWATDLAADYPTGYTGHDPMQNLPLLRGTVPMVISHATNDTALPYHSNVYLVQQVNDPQVTFRQPDVTGGHQGPILVIPPTETADFFENNWTAYSAPDLRGTGATVAPAGATQVAVPLPVAQPGDLLLCAATFDADPGAVTPPPGWTALRTVVATGGGFTQHIAWRIADGTEGAAATWQWATAVDANAGIAAYYGVDPDAPFDVESVQQFDVAAATFTHTGVTTTGRGRLLVGAVSINSASKAINPPVAAGWAEAFEATGGQVVEVAQNGTPQAQPGASGTVTWTVADATTTKASVWLGALRPAST